MKFILLSTFAYCLVTFPYAVVWHMVLFKSLYQKWEYFGSNAKPQLGLLSMIIQGVVLSIGLSLLPQYQSTLGSTMMYVFLCGVFFWSSHVLATMAKHAESRNMSFLLLETIYLFFQFLLFGLCTYGVYTFL